MLMRLPFRARSRVEARFAEVEVLSRYLIRNFAHFLVFLVKIF